MLVLRGVVRYSIRDVLFSVVSGDPLRLCQRPDPLVIIEYFCCGLLLCLEDYEPRGKEVATFIRRASMAT